MVLGHLQALRASLLPSLPSIHLFSQKRTNSQSQLEWKFGSLGGGCYHAVTPDTAVCTSAGSSEGRNWMVPTSLQDLTTQAGVARAGVPASPWGLGNLQDAVEDTPGTGTVRLSSDRSPALAAASLCWLGGGGGEQRAAPRSVTSHSHLHISQGAYARRPQRLALAFCWRASHSPSPEPHRSAWGKSRGYLSLGVPTCKMGMMVLMAAGALVGVQV